MDQRTRRSPARFLAPLALIAVVIAFLVIVTSSGGGGAGSATPDSATTPTAKTTPTRTTKKRSKSRTKTTRQGSAKTYTVQVGDTLGAIAGKTGVPLQRIEALNPNVDPHAMTAGQQIRLK